MRIGIIGAGPAGAICALSLLRGGRDHDVLLFDGKSFVQAGPQGCNMCAGVISGTVLGALADLGAAIPGACIQREITGHYFATHAGGVRIPKDPADTICTVFRSAGPRGEIAAVDPGFDQFLLHAALAKGAVHINHNVADVRLPAGPDAPFRLTLSDGSAYEVDVLVGAFGVNSALPKRFEQLGFGYRRPRTFRACQAELPVDPAFIEAHFGNEIKIFSLGLPQIRFGALTPKRKHITVTVIGMDLKRCTLESFLSHPQVRRHFPPDWTLPAHYCHCHPQLPVTAARNAVADRLLIIGDAHISRYLKGGIESAIFTGSLAAEMILAGKLSRRELQRGYVRPCYARYYHDNAYGRFLFTVNDFLSHVGPVTRGMLRILRREQQQPAWHNHSHTRILWHIFTGDAPYARITRDAFRPISLAHFALALFARQHRTRKEKAPHDTAE